MSGTIFAIDKIRTQRRKNVSKNEKDRLIFVTGATGYIGGRLVSRLLELG
jgi:FlaA1/EpsC-like NDP-sugar epimerase